MRDDVLKSVLDCASITGDTVIFEHRGRPLVIMGFDAYHNMIEEHQGVANLSEQELLDKINRTIALWKARTVQEDIDMVREYDTIQEPRETSPAEESIYLKVVEEVESPLSEEDSL